MNRKELIDFFTVENKNGLRCIEKYLYEKYLDLYLEIINHNKNTNISFKEKIYRYIHNINDNVKCNNCEKNVSFTNSLIKGYRKYCSRKCSGASSERYDRVKQTNLEKYGVDNPFKSDDVKNKIKQTNLEKYGVDNPFKSDDVKNKIKQTNLEKYGVEYYFLSQDFKGKYKVTMINKFNVEHYSKTTEFKKNFKTTMINKYGVDNPLKSIEIKNKLNKNINNSLFNRFKERGYVIIEFINNDKLIVKHPDGHIFTEDRKLLINRYNANIELSTILLPKYSSNIEFDIYNFIKKIEINDILKNKRKIIKGNELDIYLPSHKLAVEFNGLYWHSNLFKDHNYHLNKTLLCEEKGIQLLHVFEDEWILKKEIVKSIIKSKLNLFDQKIYARKTKIREITDNNQVREFLNNNHLQGFVGSKIKLGLFHNNELVSLMTFGKKRIAMGSKSSGNGEYEMLRFCNKLNTQIIGGASKLLNFFIKTYQPKLIISFADKRYSNGELYKTLGFKHIGNTQPNYWYFKNNEYIRYHRFGFRKDVLIREGFDAQKTEHQIMDERGYMRIYDCGNMKFELKLE